MLNTSNELNFSTHARVIARGFLQRWLLFAANALVVLFLGLTILESLRYLSVQTRAAVLVFIIIALLVGMACITVIFFLLREQRLKRTADLSIAHDIGRARPDVRDRIENSVQLSLQQTESGISEDLRALAIDRSRSLLKSVPLDTLHPSREISTGTKRLIFSSAFSLLFLLLSFSASVDAVNRWLHPRQVFDFPVPVSLVVTAEEEKLLAGDTMRLRGWLEGREYAEISLHQLSDRDSLTYALKVQDGRFRLDQPGVEESMILRAEVRNRRFWEPWSIASSPELKVQVINRPVIQDLTITIRPPGYTRLPVDVIRRDILDISAYPGSRIAVNGLASKEIQHGLLKFSDGEDLPLNVDGTRFHTEFIASTEDQIHFEISDRESISNLNPLKYPLYLRDDVPPLVKILVPARDVILNESMQLPMRIKLDDDFGFSGLVLNYRREQPEYLVADTSIYQVAVALPNPDLPTVEMNFQWDLDPLNLAPEDGVEYWFTVHDNNTYDGPQSGTSLRWTARLPSLEEMFAEIDQGHERVEQKTAEVLDIVKDIREKVDQLALEMQKDPNLSWEQQQEAEDAVQQMQDLKDQLESISEELDRMMQTVEEQQLFSDETLEKYSELQDLLQDLMTPELLEAMERLQEAMQEQDPQAMQEAMQDFQASMENFERSVERTLEILKQVELEQKIDELTGRLNELAERQEELVNDLQEGNTDQAAAKEQKISDDFQSAEQTAQELETLLNERDDLSSEPVQGLLEQMEQRQVAQDLEEATQSLQQGQMSQAQTSSRQAMQSLQELAQSAMEMQQSLQQQMMADVMAEFRQVMLKTLALSQEQEHLGNTTEETPRHSSSIRDQADSQQMLQGGLQQIARDLTALGNKTFAVSPNMGRSLGQTQSSMNEAIKELENRNPRQASKAQAAAMEHLNRMARQLANAMQSLQQSGQSSGFDQYMQQLQQMAGNQQGLNQQTMLQMGMGRQSMMQQLAQRQLQLREALRQIEEGLGSDSRMLGDLGKIGEDMEAVAKELQRRRPSERVLQQQEKILSRLLDAQRSAHQRDFSKKRTSETGGWDQAWQGVGDLPEDLGEARNLLYEELLRSLKQGYSREEQNLIREYFENLEKALQ